MPTIVTIGNIRIRMFADDHNPPHFHVLTPDHEALVLISDFTVLRGSIDRRSYEIALRWASENRELLDNEWQRLNER
jgi:hypothetical protein